MKVNVVVHSDVNSKKELHLSLKERIDIIRNNRIYLKLFPFVMLILIMTFFSISTDGKFFKLSALKRLVSQTIIIGTCATGVSFIYSNGNLDISIGSVLGLSGTLGIMAYNATGSIPALILVCVGAAVLLMTFNCTMSVICHIKTITVAIVVMQIYSAVTALLIGGTGKVELSYEVCKQMENGGFRLAAFAGYFLFSMIIFHTTKVGRTLRFIGGNENCAKQSGMNNEKMTFISFIVTGIGIGFAAIFSAIDVGSITSETGTSLGMDVMLATVLGGMSIFGGAKSNAYAGLIGALTVTALNKGLLMMGVSASVIQGIRGVIFIILVYLNSERQSLLPARVQF